jgi:hypothetical protein
MGEQLNLTRFCDNFPFLNIFKAFRIALQPARVLTAFLALLIIFVAGWLMDFTKTVVVSGSVAQKDYRFSGLTGTVTYPTELHCFVSAPDRLDSFINTYKDLPNAEKTGVFNTLSNFCIAGFNQAVISILTLRFDTLVSSVTECVLALVWAIKYHIVYTVIFLLVSLVVISIAGGAICRGAAMQFSKGQIVGLSPCVRFSLKKFVSLFCTILAPIILVASFGYVIILLIGLLANIPWAGEIIFALSFAIVLFTGVIMAFVVIWAMTGGTLLFGAMGYESSDSFDIITRTFIYLRAKPWLLAFYSVVAAVYGAICYLFVRFFAFLTLLLGRYFLGVIMWTKAGKAETINKLDVLWPQPEFFNLAGNSLEIAKRGTESLAAFIVYLEILAIAGIVFAVAMSFYFSANSIIYCLLRKNVDNTPLEEVFVAANPIMQQRPEVIEKSAGAEQPE